MSADFCLYDNPKTLRREYWKNGVEGYSICAFVIKSKRVPLKFSEEWRVDFEIGKVVGDIEHVKYEARP